MWENRVPFLSGTGGVADVAGVDAVAVTMRASYRGE